MTAAIATCPMTRADGQPTYSESLLNSIERALPQFGFEPWREIHRRLGYGSPVTTRHALRVMAKTGRIARYIERRGIVDVGYYGRALAAMPHAAAPGIAACDGLPVDFGAGE